MEHSERDIGRTERRLEELTKREETDRKRDRRTRERIGDFHTTIGIARNEAKKQREGLFLFWPGGPKPLLVVANPAAARRVLGSQKLFPKGSDYGDKFGTVFGKGLVTSEGADHARAPSNLRIGFWLALL